MSPRLSVVVIALNEETDLPGCLESARDAASELVVVDSGSKDRTAAVARRYTPAVHRREFADYASQKQRAADLATGDWVLSLDADERLTPELARELAELLAGEPPHAGYRIPFEVWFLGRRLRHGGLGREEHLRLFRRSSGRFIGGGLHEGVEVRGTVGRLAGAIRHVPYRDIDDYLSKMSGYTTLAARKRRERGERFSPLHHLLPLWEFFVRTVLRLGVLDGTPGLAWAGLSAFHTWVKYLKLKQLEKTP